ncbi:uncharacterized protein LOC127131890 [Lathyrus oleraceus]|uniref:uncharacterized protein LOC127131889 n=1 Tax=Pisum sativum TaxID=3888 RepID=UPI0021CFFA04|nr:uncharacterized protein LOC127131889 [Pisum sativum]XP_050916736.1 uncharacterized protein LOC127131890 [Pisum sativum]
MDSLEQNHIALRGDVDSMKKQIDRLMEAMIDLAKREDNIQQTAVVENVVLAPVNSLTQPQLAQTPVNNSVVQKRHIVRDKGSSYHDDVEYHSFAFSVPDSHGTSLVDSLTGASLSWYMKLERNHVQSWMDLANAFLNQYKYNLDMAPDRMQLRALSQESNESFRGYAQRWKELAARVEPPLLDKEVMELFRDTLQSPYFERMISSAASDFAHLVSIGERIENGLKSGKIQCASNSQSMESESIPSSQKEEEAEINAVWEAPQASHQTSFSPHGQYPTTQGPLQHQQQIPPQQPYK